MFVGVEVLGQRTKTGLQREYKVVGLRCNTTTMTQEKVKLCSQTVVEETEVDTHIGKRSGHPRYLGVGCTPVDSTNQRTIGITE